MIFFCGFQHSMLIVTRGVSATSGQPSVTGVAGRLITGQVLRPTSGSRPFIVGSQPPSQSVISATAPGGRTLQFIGRPVHLVQGSRGPGAQIVHAVRMRAASEAATVSNQVCSCNVLSFHAKLMQYTTCSNDSCECFSQHLKCFELVNIGTVIQVLYSEFSMKPGQLSLLKLCQLSYKTFLFTHTHTHARLDNPCNPPSRPPHVLGVSYPQFHLKINRFFVSFHLPSKLRPSSVNITRYHHFQHFASSVILCFPQHV